MPHYQTCKAGSGWRPAASLSNSGLLMDATRFGTDCIYKPK